MMNNSQGASSFFSGLSTLLGRPHPLLHNLSDTTERSPEGPLRPGGRNGYGEGRGGGEREAFQTHGTIISSGLPSSSGFTVVIFDAGRTFSFPPQALKVTAGCDSYCLPHPDAPCLRQHLAQRPPNHPDSSRTVKLPVTLSS